MIKNYIVIHNLDNIDKIEISIYKSTISNEHKEAKLVNTIHINSKFKLLDCIEELSYGDTVILEDYNSVRVLIEDEARLNNTKYIIITRSINQGYRVIYNNGKKSADKKHIELLDTSIDRILYYNDKLKES